MELITASFTFRTGYTCSICGHIYEGKAVYYYSWPHVARHVYLEGFDQGNLQTMDERERGNKEKTRGTSSGVIDRRDRDREREGESKFQLGEKESQVCPQEKPCPASWSVHESIPVVRMEWDACPA
jgi:hypothetical protein